MDQKKTGEMIRVARLKKNMTQRQLAEKLYLSDKAVSKWERGWGSPDLSILPLLADCLDLDISALLAGNQEENEMENGNMKKLQFYVCPVCHNLIFSLSSVQVSCCGQKLSALQPQNAREEEHLQVEKSDGELAVFSDHAMTKEHYISFVALLTGDMVIVKKQYPEWGLETRLPCFPHSTLIWYCTQHGLFAQPIRKSTLVPTKDKQKHL